MAVAMLFSPRSMNQEQYRRIVDKLQQAGAGELLERSFHVCFGSGDNLRIFDVWDSEEALRAALEHVMPPILAEVGVELAWPEVFSVVRAVS